LVAACAVLDTALPEREPLPAQYEGLLMLLYAIERDSSWPAVYVRWEASLLADLGFGLDLSSCALTGVTEDLAFVSPRSGRAVSAEAGAPWRQRLLTLPAFLIDPAAVAAASDIAAGLTLTGHFLGRCVYREQGGKTPPARERLPAALTRAFAGGLAEAGHGG
jgi:DNA repair protein RecO (recombination protein O)